VGLSIAALCGAPAWAQDPAVVPSSAAAVEAPDVGIAEKIGAPVPHDIVLTRADGQQVRFGDLLDGKRPLLIMLHYSDCPSLCNVQLGGLVTGLRDLSWTPGEDFEIVTVSMDPRESSTRAAATQARYLAEYGRPGAERGWHFYTGPEAQVGVLAHAIGFRYAWVESSKEYAHAAAAIFLTPHGTVARYLHGAVYDGPTLKLALLEASEGSLGGVLDRLTATCFRYEPAERRYVLDLASIVGLLAAVGVAAFALFAGLGRARAAQEAPSAAPGTPASPR
jgi:protein SCO1/2